MYLIHLFKYVFICLFIHLCIYLCIYLFIYVFEHLKFEILDLLQMIKKNIGFVSNVEHIKSENLKFYMFVFINKSNT